MLVEVVAGLAAGALHVWSGPDHLAAVAPLAVRGRRRSWAVGMRWGIGHSAGVAAVALFLVWARGLVSPELLSEWGERLVGVMLVGIGLWGLRTAFRAHVHAHPHEHDGAAHAHIHVHAHGHEPGTAAPALRTIPNHVRAAAVPSHLHTHAAMGVGILHGIAGSSHFLGVLPALAFPTLRQAVAYIAAYAVGTIASMMAFGALMDLLTARTGRAGERAYHVLMGAASAVAAGVGVFWIVTS
jgi:sulfite exporter TauE/SafE